MTPITKKQYIKILTVALYAGASAIVASLIAFLNKNPEAIGAYTAIVNVILVTIAKLLEDGSKKEADEQ